MDLEQRFILIESKFEIIKTKIKDLSLTEEDWERNFLSIKDQLKNLNVPFYRFISKKQYTVLLNKKELLGDLKGLIERKKKESIDLKDILLSIQSTNEFKNL